MSNQPRSIRNGRLPIQGRTALMKFFFTNQKHIPPGIPLIERWGNETVDLGHAVEGAILGVNRVGIGRVRSGRVDTGLQVISNLPEVRASMLESGLTENGLSLVNLHWFVKPADRSGGDKYVVCATFHSGKPMELTEPTARALHELAAITWGYCHVWQNPNGVDSINLLLRRWDSNKQQSTQPRHLLVVRNGYLEAIRAAGPQK